MLPRIALGLLCLALNAVAAQLPEFGPFNAAARGAGPGHWGWFDGVPPTEAPSPWTIATWVRVDKVNTGRTLVAGMGDGLDFSGAQRYFAFDSKGWFFFLGATVGTTWHGTPSAYDAPKPEQLNGGRVDTAAPVKAGVWQHLAATYDGATVCLFVDGQAAGHLTARLARAAMQVRVGPPPTWDDGSSFAGRVAQFSIWSRTYSAPEIAALAASAPDFATSTFVAAPDGPTPASRREIYVGRRSESLPQDPKTLPGPLPQFNANRIAKLTPTPVAQPGADGRLVLDRGWQMAEASPLRADPAALSASGYDTTGWYDATVPGTVLTTLVQQGLYPDPLHGLNNLLIPDTLSRKTWWYRVEFDAPTGWQDRQIRLRSLGINYHAEFWLNGRRLGTTTGAFLRGEFDVAPLLHRNSRNVLAIRVWPQPHNGQAHEEATESGVGPNGADGVLDGPTFFCSEGWDWIPTIRDRNTGIWQPVVLEPSGPVALADANVVTHLPRLPDLTRAEVTVSTTIRNTTAQPRAVTVRGTLAGATFNQAVSLAPGETREIVFAPADHPQLVLAHPRLWWPNGFGEPALHDLSFAIDDGSARLSDTRTWRVGLRTVTYEYNPQLTVLVNGRRIFCKGGNWGLDDAMKRLTRERLEPYFRLHREANLTMIRNWCGQNTSDLFYQLCDEYGLLVYNDFWLTTNPSDLAAADADLFLANAEDTVRRIRHHPSIALWSGRNEGWPPPWIFQGLADLLERLDGTRTFVPSSWSEPVSGAGPYNYFGPQAYFDVAKAKPFNTELGVDSIPTADALRAMLAPDQLWPISDSWRYHDLHAVKWGKGHLYLEGIAKEYGPATGFEDFVRRAQMLNYVTYRAMFEGWNARMWRQASGVLLWMTHPAWGSNTWQIYSHDYDTHAAFFATKKACEPVHVQWNCSDSTVAIVNTLATPLPDARVVLVVLALDGTELDRRKVILDAAPFATTNATTVVWPASDPAAPVQFLKLELRDREDRLLSENFYWRSPRPEDQRALEQLPSVELKVTAGFGKAASESLAIVTLTNPTPHLALMAHVVLRDAATGERILPAYASDNYVSFLPGEMRTLTIAYPRAVNRPLKITLDGWNVKSAELQVE